MNAVLVLASGSHAGAEEPLKHGYYMIGRHKECQIRPKSHSVSRRHCILHHTPEALKVFDLGSTNGTLVNDHRVDVNEWLTLQDGDLLRCGKIAFNVVVHESPSGMDPSASPKLEGFQDFDIAEFLESEDDAERQELYGDTSEHYSVHQHSGGEVDEESIHSLDEHLHATVSTSLNAVEGDAEAEAVLEKARSKAQLKHDEKLRREHRAKRIAAIREKIESERQNIEREYEISRQLNQMLKKKSDLDSSGRYS